MMQFINHAFTINLRGKLLDVTVPKIMGIINITPDSFFSESRSIEANQICHRVASMIESGMDILDVGACSTRPGIEQVSEQEELARLRMAMEVIRNKWPDLPVSIDTYRASVASEMVQSFKADMINDISGGSLDEKMFETIARLQVPYVLSHIQGNPTTMQLNPGYEDITTDICQYFSQKMAELLRLGVNDIVLDPGFGFGKTLQHNYQLLKGLDELTILNRPMLIGISRKSMIYKFLNIDPEQSLNGTTVLHTMALMGGASILRVHDVKEAKEAILLYENLKNCSAC
jgi:dihydropteroate synthase